MARLSANKVLAVKITVGWNWYKKSGQKNRHAHGRIAVKLIGVEWKPRELGLAKVSLCSNGKTLYSEFSTAEGCKRNLAISNQGSVINSCCGGEFLGIKYC